MAKNMTGVCTKSLYDLISSVDMSMHAAADDEGLGCEKPQFLRRKVGIDMVLALIMQLRVRITRPDRFQGFHCARQMLPSEHGRRLTNQFAPCGIVDIPAAKRTCVAIGLFLRLPLAFRWS